jgi:hypothetical protein
MGCSFSCGVKQSMVVESRNNISLDHKNQAVNVWSNQPHVAQEMRSECVIPVCTPSVPIQTPSSELSTALLSNVTNVVASAEISASTVPKSSLNEHVSAGVTLFLSSSGKYHRNAECAGKNSRPVLINSDVLPEKLCQRRRCLFSVDENCNSVVRRLEFGPLEGQAEELASQREISADAIVNSIPFCPSDSASNLILETKSAPTTIDHGTVPLSDPSPLPETQLGKSSSSILLAYVSSTGKHHVSQPCAGTKAKPVNVDLNRLPANLCMKPCCFKTRLRLTASEFSVTVATSETLPDCPSGGATESSIPITGKTPSPSAQSTAVNTDESVHSINDQLDVEAEPESAKMHVEAAPLPGRPFQHAITVASWNVCGSQSDTLQDGFTKKEGIATVLQFLYESFDVVSLQEVAKPLARHLKNAYAGHFYIDEGELSRPDARMLNGWLTRLDAGTVLQYDWETGVSAGGAGRVLGERILCTYKHVTIRVNTGGGSLYLTSFHTPGASKSSRAREAEVRTVIDHLSNVSVSRPDVVHVFVGDCNWHLLPADSRGYALRKCSVHVPTEPTTDTSRSDRKAADVLISTAGKVAVSPVLVAPRLYGSDHKFIYCSLSLVQ